MTKEPIKPDPVLGDKMVYTTKGPVEFKADGYKYSAESGEWVVITREYATNKAGWNSWCYDNMRPATQEEIDKHLGPVRWWQWRRKRAARKRMALPPMKALNV